jgi:hypothetical protein
MTPAGKPLQRVMPGQQMTSSVEVRLSSDLTTIPAGRASDVVFSITNYGASGVFNLIAKDSRGFLVSGPAATLTLGNGQTSSVVLRLLPPAMTASNTKVALSLTASGATAQASNSASRVLTVEPSNSAPICSAASANPSIIRAVNHKMVPVSIIGVTDVDNDPATITITSIIQDEPVVGDFDASGIGQSTARVRAERSGQGDGRLYRIGFDASDGRGGVCSGSVTVEVPHDNRTSAPESARYYRSTAR